MKTKTFITIGFCAVIFGLTITGCKRGKTAARIDPHSPEGVNLAIQAQQVPLTEAVKTNDLKFVHVQMYEIEQIADVLSSTLQGEKKERGDAILAKLKQATGEIKEATEKIDNSAGRQQQAEIAASLEILFAVFKELDAEFKTKAGKK